MCHSSQLPPTMLTSLKLLECGVQNARIPRGLVAAFWLRCRRLKKCGSRRCSLVVEQLKRHKFVVCVRTSTMKVDPVSSIESVPSVFIEIMCKVV